MIKTFQKEHIMVLLQFEMKSFIMDKVRSEKVRRNSIREIVTYFNVSYPDITKIRFKKLEPRNERPHSS